LTSDSVWRAAAVALGGTLFAFLVLPVVALFVTSGPVDWIAGLRHPITGPALALSLATTSLSLALTLVLGTPLAYWLGRSEGRLARVAGTLVQLPIVIPPAVAGIALLLTFGRRGLLGSATAAAGIDIAFTTIAVVLAQVFVAAPFFLQSAAAAFAALDVDLLIVARTLGASRVRVFMRIVLPLARPGLAAGAAMAWARALGEFGATLMFAGNLPGKTQTLPLAVYTALESDLRAAQALAVILVLVSFALLVVLRRPLPGRNG
jgi:molybdate transport system permease protein